jgi:putative copper export protein
MSTLLRALHLLSLALWFGSVAFFSFCTALPIIRTMEEHATQPGHWLGLKEKKQGVRVAGDALEPVFARYFPVQVGCGAIALLTTSWWTRWLGRFGWLRRGLIFVALLLACANAFVLAPQVHELRTQRYGPDETAALQASADFNTWHTYSLISDMVGLACVTAALGLAVVGASQRAASPPSRS